jgi:hypothetical protein
MRTIESKEICKRSSCGFLDDRECRSDLEDVELELSGSGYVKSEKLLTFVFKTARSISDITPT